MRIIVCFLLLAGLICKCTSQNLQQGAGIPVAGQNPNLPPPPAGARNNITSAQNSMSAGSANQQPAAGSSASYPQGPTVGGPTGNQQPPQSGATSGNQQNNNAGQAQGVGNSTYQHQPTPLGNQRQPTGPGVGTGNQQPPAAGSSSGNQQPPVAGTGAGAGNQQSPAAGSSSGNQQSPAAGTGAGAGNQQSPAAGSSSGNQQSPVAGTGAGAGNQQSPAAGSSSGNQQPPVAGTGAGAGNQQSPAAGSSSGNQQSPVAGTGAGAGNQQSPAAGSSSGNQQSPAAGTASGNQQPQAPSTRTQVPTTTTTTTTPAPTTTTTSTQAPTTPKYTIITTCPATWKKYKKACYQMFSGGDVKNFKSAENYCRAQKGNLASVNDKYEYAYLMKEFMDTLPNVGAITSIWIGLYCKDGKDFFWTDGSDTDGKAFYKPGLMYFKRHLKLATITLSKMGTMNGYFGVPMTKSLPYICEISLGGKKKTRKEYACGYGWKLFKGRCYQMFQEYERFFAAERQCNQYQGHLVSLNSEKEHKFVSGLFKTKHPEFGTWVGMVKIKHNNAQPTFEWIDGSLTDYTPPTVFDNQPAPNPNYGAMYKNSSIFDVTPYYQLPFICEREIPVGCELGWDRFQDFCYLVSKTPSTIVEGKKLCEKDNATLASVCSFEEYKHMMRTLHLFGLKGVWTGAYFLKLGKEELLVWSDRRGCTFHPPGKYGGGFDKFAVLSNSGLKREAGTKKFPVMCKKMAKTECIGSFKKIYQHDDPLLLVTSASDVKECKKACLEKDGCDGCTFAEYQGNKMCYLHHQDGGQLPMMTSVDLQHWKLCKNY